MKRAGELLRSVFKILWNKPEGLTAKEVLSLIPKVVRLTEDELRYSPETNSLHYQEVRYMLPLKSVHFLSSLE